MKLIINFFIILFLFSCASESLSTDQRPIDFIPSSSLLVFQSKNLTQTSSVLLENSFFKNNKDVPFFEQIKKRIQFFESFESLTNGVICFSNVGKKDIATTFITSSNDFDFQLIKNDLINPRKFTYEGKTIYEFDWKEKQLFAVWFGKILFVSDFKLIVENKIRDDANSLPTDPNITKLLKTVDASYPSVYIQVEAFESIYQKGFSKESYQLFNNLTDWVALDLKSERHQLRLTGVSISDTEKKRKLNLLSGQNRIEHTLPKVVPLSATGFESYSITDFKKFNAQRKNHGYDEINSNTIIFENIKAVGKIYFDKDEVLVIQSKSTETLTDNLRPFLKKNKRFRNYEIFEIHGIDLINAYLPLIEINPPTYVSQIGESFILASTLNVLEQVIISQENGLTLQANGSYQTQIADLSISSNVLMYALTKNWFESMQSHSKESFRKDFNTIDLANYEGLAIQYNVEEEFAYVNAIFKEVENKKNEAKVQQKNRFKLSSQSLTSPQFFTNWRTKQRDVLVQNQNLVVQLVDVDGKMIWDKKLGDIIIGKIEEFDIYKNSRIQMAFATSNKIYVLDKNGEEVAPFPVEFISPITQALQIFDYDKNGEYRFMVCQEKSLKAFDKGGNEVKGFSFITQNSAISTPPKHIRLGKKDYILVQEESGLLHILDRRGNDRVSYNTNAVFSGKPWFEYDGKFTSTTTDGNVVQIEENGKVKIIEKGLAPNHHIVANQRLLVTFSENILQINEVEIELNYGIYTAPQILEHHDKNWVSITDKQANKLYIFDEFGNSIAGFPVFGTSAVEYFGTASNTLQVMVEGESEAILIYEIE